MTFRYSTDCSCLTNFSPNEFLYGKNTGNAELPFTHNQIPKLHPLLLSRQKEIENLHKEVQTMVQITKENITQRRIQTNTKKNATRTHKDYSVGDIVFVLDQTFIPGNPRPLKSKFYQSPYKIEKLFMVTALVRRLADNFMTIYRLDRLKLYKNIDPQFLTLPNEILHILKHTSSDFDLIQLEIIRKLDPLDIPTGLDLSNHPMEAYQNENENLLETDNSTLSTQDSTNNMTSSTNKKSEHLTENSAASNMKLNEQISQNIDKVPKYDDLPNINSENKLDNKNNHATSTPVKNKSTNENNTFLSPASSSPSSKTSIDVSQNTNPLETLQNSKLLSPSPSTRTQNSQNTDISKMADSLPVSTNTSTDLPNNSTELQPELSESDEDDDNNSPSSPLTLRSGKQVSFS